MNNLLSILSVELSALLAATDKREYVITRAERLFDESIEPVDLPGPDAVIDPLLRVTIRPLIGRVYDEMLLKIKAAT